MNSTKYACLGTLLMSLVPATAGAQSLIANGGFEAGSDGWSGGTAVTTSPHSGSRCLEVRDEDSSGDVCASTVALHAITTGLTYQLEIYVRTPTNGQATLVTVSQHRQDGTWIPYNNIDLPVIGSTSWTRFALPLRAFHAEARSVQVHLRPVLWTEAGDNVGVAWFDDVRLVPVAATAPRGMWLHDDGTSRLWLSPVEQRVARDAELELAAPHPASIELYAAAAESEPMQIVLSSSVDTSLIAAQLTLAGPPHAGAAGSPALRVTWREVVRVTVTQPTDGSSYAGELADPLPPLELPLAVPSNTQVPLWINIDVSRTAAPGDYAGAIDLLLASGASMTVPVVLHVFDFALPRQHHLRTSYGLWPYDLYRYHNVGSDPARRQALWRLYLDDFAAHRVSPTDMSGDATFTVSFPTLNWAGGEFVADPLSAANTVLRVVDDSTTTTMSARTSIWVPLAAGQSYTLSWRARTEGVHDYLVTVTQLTATGAFIPFNNIDYWENGDGTWQTRTETIAATRWHPDAAYLIVSLSGCWWTESGERTGTTYFDDVLLAPAGNSTNAVVNGDCESAGDPDTLPIAIDFSRFDAAAAYALDVLQLDSFMLSLPGMAGGDCNSTHEGSIAGYGWGTPAYRTVMRRLIRSLTRHLEAKGWLDRAYTYWIDEPPPGAWGLVEEGMELIAEAEPRLARLLTINVDRDAIAPTYFDIAVPILNLYDQAWAAARRAEGDEVWWYVCTGPRAPYPNNFIDHDALETRLQSWLAWKYGVDGMLYWTTNYWTHDVVFPPTSPNAKQDPWSDPQSYTSVNGVTSRFGNGDGRLLYPPRAWQDGTERLTAPVPSLRWELLREGLEDYEYLWLLRHLTERLEDTGRYPALVAAARAVAIAPDIVAASLVQYTADSTLVASHRRALGAMISALQATLAADTVGQGDEEGPADGDSDTPGGADAGDGNDDGGADGAVLEPADCERGECPSSDGDAQDDELDGSDSGAHGANGACPDESHATGCSCAGPGATSASAPEGFGVAGSLAMVAIVLLLGALRRLRAAPSYRRPGTDTPSSGAL